MVLQNYYERITLFLDSPPFQGGGDRPKGGGVVMVGRLHRRRRLYFLAGLLRKALISRGKWLISLRHIFHKDIFVFNLISKGYYEENWYLFGGWFGNGYLRCGFGP